MYPNDIENIYKAINRVSNRVNDMSEKLDSVMQTLNAQANNKISVNAGGIDDIADMTATHDSAIDDLATIVSTLGGE